MGFEFTNINGLAILCCVVAGQILLTIWFVVLFAGPWAKANGVSTKQEHTAQIPSYTYGIGAACVLFLSLGLAALQNGLHVTSLVEGLAVGLFVSVFLVLTTMIPGYAFLKRWSAFAITSASQVTLIFVISTILAVWP